MAGCEWAFCSARRAVWLHYRASCSICLSFKRFLLLTVVTDANVFAHHPVGTGNCDQTWAHLASEGFQSPEISDCARGVWMIWLLFSFRSSPETGQSWPLCWMFLEVIHSLQFSTLTSHFRTIWIIVLTLFFHTSLSLSVVWSLCRSPFHQTDQQCFQPFNRQTDWLPV